MKENELREEPIEKMRSNDCAMTEEKPYREPRISLLKNHRIEIRFADVGCSVSVGCKNFAFTSIDHAMEEVLEYVNNPHESIERWNETMNKLNKL